MHALALENALNAFNIVKKRKKENFEKVVIRLRSYLFASDFVRTRLIKKKKGYIPKDAKTEDPYLE